MRYTCLSQIAEVLSVAGKERPIAGFSVDSRTVKKGDLYFALRGERVDGHDYLKEVASKGGAAAIVDGSYRGESCGLELIRVPDVLGALHRLATQLHQKRKQRVVGVTGSVGKTTTKEFLATLLSHRYSVTKTPGNNNSQIGLPLAILNDPGTAEFFVMEMGMEQAGGIAKLVKLAPPEIGVITKITHQHQKFFPEGITGIAAAKAEIFSDPSTAVGVVNCSAMAYDAIRQGGSCPKKTFGLAPATADFVLESDRRISEGEAWSPSLPLPFSESHLCENFVGAVGVCRWLGLSWEEIAQGVPHLKSIPLRFQRLEKNGITFINDCYNADPDSMVAAISNLPMPRFGGKTVAVLGGMTQLGSYSEQGHRDVALAALNKVDHLLCLGKDCLPMVEIFNRAGRPVDYFRTLNELKTVVEEILKSGDVVLIKGSNSHKLWQILEP